MIEKIDDNRINELTEAMDIIIMKNRDRQDKETISRLTQKEQSIN